MSDEDPVRCALESGRYDHVVQLYEQAASAAERRGDIDEACFYLTQGWVLALQYDLPERLSLQQRLAAHNRIW